MRKLFKVLSIILCLTFCFSFSNLVLAAKNKNIDVIRTNPEWKEAFAAYEKYSTAMGPFAPNSEPYILNKIFTHRDGTFYDINEDLIPQWEAKFSSGASAANDILGKISGLNNNNASNIMESNKRTADIADGWIKQGSYWYYYRNGSPVKNQWIDTYYYVGSDGRMATNKTIDNRYRVGADGKWDGIDLQQVRAQQAAQQAAAQQAAQQTSSDTGMKAVTSSNKKSNNTTSNKNSTVEIHNHYYNDTSNNYNSTNMSSGSIKEQIKNQLYQILGYLDSLN